MSTAAIGGIDGGVDTSQNNVTVDASTVDQSTVDTTQIQQETETQDSGDSTEEQQHGEDALSAQGGAERFKSVIEEVKKSNPALAKELKTTLYAYDALKKEFPGGVQEMRQMKSALDELGGAEGIEGLKGERQEWKEIDEKFASGDASVLDTFAKFNPEGYAKLIPAALDKLSTIDKPAYDYALAGIFVSTLDSWKFGDQLERLFDDLSQVVDGNGKQLLTSQMQRLQGLYQQYQSLQDLAKTAPKPKTDDTTKQLSEERAQIASERAKMSGESVARATNDYAGPKIESFLAVEAKNQKLNLDALKKADLGDGKTAFSRMQSEINEEIGRMIAADKPYVQKIRDSISAGRTNDAVKLSNAKFDQVHQAAVKKVVRLWAMMNPKGPAAAKTSHQPATGVKKLESQPDPSLLDQKDPNWKKNYMWGKGKLKSTGQAVEW